MHTEYEVRILEIDSKRMIEKLESLHAKLLFDAVQRRYVYDFKPAEKNRWIRLRTNGEKSTLTIKNVATSNIDGTQELEIVVDNFDRTHLILKELGYEERSYQENRRIQYDLNGVEIDIDTWPKMPTYMEVEGSSEEAVYHALDVLGIDREDCTSLDVESIYGQYGIDIKNIRELKFEEEIK
jgi:adenylate cyclase class 2